MIWYAFCHGHDFHGLSRCFLLQTEQIKQQLNFDEQSDNFPSSSSEVNQSMLEVWISHFRHLL